MSKKDNEGIDSENNDVDDTENLGDDDTATPAQGDVEADDDESSVGSFEDTDDPDELKEQLRKSQDHSRRMFERAKKAEGFKKVKDPNTGKMVWVKKNGDQAKPPAKNNSQNDNAQNQHKSDLTMDDFYALQEAKVPRQDVDMVKRYAAANNMSIAEALQEDIVKATLRNKAEERRTADATNTDRTRRTPGKQTPESLLSRAKQGGELPDSDDDMAALAEQRLNDTWKKN